MSPDAVNERGCTALNFAADPAMFRLLLAAGANPNGPDPEPGGFTPLVQAAIQAYAEVLQKLSSICGHAPRSWTKAKGVFNFHLTNFGVLAALHGDDWVPSTRVSDLRAQSPRAERHLDLLEDEVRAAGFYLVLSESRGELLEAKLRLFPTAEKFVVVATSGIHGNHGLGSREIIDWLLDLDAENPFVVTLCAKDSLAGRFLQPVKNASTWAQRILQLCPDFEATPEEETKELEQTGRFYLGWN
jgi:hypothetical protein